MVMDILMPVRTRQNGGCSCVRMSLKNGCLEKDYIVLNPNYSNNGWDGGIGAPSQYFLHFRGTVLPN